jgi:ABC-type branched-subunit amino acid transport system substrate-binding protein
VSYALGNETKAYRNNFSPQAAPAGYQTGMFTDWTKRYGSAVTKVGSIFPNIAAAVTSQQNFEAAAGSVGWHWIYSQSYPAAQTNYTSEIAQMKLKGVRIIFMVGQTAQAAATIVQEAHSQNWHPIIIAPIAYASDFVKDLGSAKDAEGITGSNLYALFFNHDEAHNIPEVALYQHWMAQAHPGAALDLYSMYAWASAMLFVQALEAMGPRPTRAKLLTELRKIHRFDANGMLPSNDPAGKKPPLCYVLWTIHDGAFHRINTPTTRFRCNGRFHYT